MGSPRRYDEIALSEPNGHMQDDMACHAIRIIDVVITVRCLTCVCSSDLSNVIPLQIPSGLVVCCDETYLTYNMAPNNTFEVKGSQSVKLLEPKPYAPDARATHVTV